MRPPVVYPGVSAGAEISRSVTLNDVCSSPGRDPDCGMAQLNRGDKDVTANATCVYSTVTKRPAVGVGEGEVVCGREGGVGGIEGGGVGEDESDLGITVDEMGVGGGVEGGDAGVDESVDVGDLDGPPVTTLRYHLHNAALSLDGRSNHWSLWLRKGVLL